ncbi:hypothetical protein ACF0H5_022758 [Mactra antiquata]
MMKNVHQNVLLVAVMSSAVIGIFAYFSSLPVYLIPSTLGWQTSGMYKNSYSKTDKLPHTMITNGINKTIVYDIDILHKELLKIHNKLYERKPNDQCEVREPACVILGVAKSGTQELVDFASSHPYIVLKPGLAKPNMFAKNKDIRRKALLRNGTSSVPCSYSDQTLVVKSDDFLFREGMAKKLYEFNPNLKMILITREPVSRMISGYSFSYFQKKLHKERFLYRPEMLPEMDHHFVDPSSGIVHRNADRDLSTYHEGLKRYLKLFPLDQILVLESNEFKGNPVKVLQRVEKFLNIKPVITDDFFTYVDFKGFYCLDSDKIYCYASDRGRKVMKELKPKTMKILKEYFKPLNKKFFKQIGKEFDW